MKFRKPSQSGFTLLEVLVALGILAVALGAVIQSVSQATSNISYLRDKTFAHWVAMNRAVEIQAGDSWPSIGTNEGSEVMAGHEWFWKETVSEPPGAEELAQAARRVEIEVRRERKSQSPVVSIMMFVGKPLK